MAHPSSNVILGAQKPHYLPSFKYLYKICKSDLFLFTDHLLYRKQSPTSRAVIPSFTGALRLTIPVCIARSKNRVIWSLQTDKHSFWYRKHLKTLELQYKYAPYFEYYFPSLQALYEKDNLNLADFSWWLLKWHGQLLFPEKPIYRSSQEGIITNVDLLEWVKQKGIRTLVYYAQEEEYYLKNFSGKLSLRKIFPPEISIKRVISYHAVMAFLPIIFYYGPEAKRFFE